jgi:alkylhydroperoxidase family enzyme
VTEETRCRVPLVDTPEPPADQLFDRFRNEGNAVPNLYRALANSPEVCKAWTDLAWPLRRAATTRALRELAISYQGMRRHSRYVETHHLRFARDRGVTAEQIAALGPDRWDPAGPFSEVERLALTLVDEVVEDGTASTGTVARLIQVVGDRQAVVLIATVAFYETVCVINRSLQVPLEH